MKKVTQNLHADFFRQQVVVLLDYFSQVTTKWGWFFRADA
jgi:hypothetical protein